MAYTEIIYRSPVCIEHSIYYAGNYGAKGEKRKPKRKATPEQIEKQNRKNKANRIRHLIQLNFSSDDYYLTLCYPAFYRPTLEEVERDFKSWIRKTRAEYKKHDEEFKYIYRLEMGKRGGIHAHIILNRCKGLDRNKLDIMWMDIIYKNHESKTKKTGCIHWEMLHPHPEEQSPFDRLAEYMSKEPPDIPKYKDLAADEQKKIVKYGSSRNLIRPQLEKKKYNHWTVKKLLELGAEGINQQNRYKTPGYIVIKRSWQSGFNPVTGLSYIKFTEIRGHDFTHEKKDRGKPDNKSGNVKKKNRQFPRAGRPYGGKLSGVRL